MTSIEDAARAYVAARLRNESAEPCDWSARAAEVDRTWHELLDVFEGEPVVVTVALGQGVLL
jgi:hypothetical protein